MQQAIKHTLDRVGALLLLIAVSPLLFLLAILIALDGGPVFFKQQRLGRNAKPFRIYKFRTMVVDADNLLNENGEATINRITPVGRLLRRTSFDELAQLINIVRGEMSFVGPRPTLTEHYKLYDQEQKKRFKMKPGITGLAQVNGRNSLKWTKRLEYDSMYVETFSLLLDFKILVKTFGVVIKGTGMSMDRNASQVNDLSDNGYET